MGRITVTAAILTIFGGVSSWGDVVHLKNGGAVEGIVTEEGDWYSVQTTYGVSKIRKADVAKVDWVKSPLAEYRERASALKGDDVVEWFELGRWAQKEGLTPQAEEAFRNVLAAEPDHQQAREALGYVFEAGRWITRDEQMAAKGWIQVEGKWISPEAAKLQRALAEKEAIEAEASRAEALAREAEARAREAEALAARAAQLAQAEAAKAAAAQARAAAARDEAERARALREARWAELEIERLRHLHCPTCHGHPPDDHR